MENQAPEVTAQGFASAHPAKAQPSVSTASLPIALEFGRAGPGFGALVSPERGAEPAVGGSRDGPSRGGAWSEGLGGSRGQRWVALELEGGTGSMGVTCFGEHTVFFSVNESAGSSIYGAEPPCLQSSQCAGSVHLVSLHSCDRRWEKITSPSVCDLIF